MYSISHALSNSIVLIESLLIKYFEKQSLKDGQLLSPGRLRKLCQHYPHRLVELKGSQLSQSWQLHGQPLRIEESSTRSSIGDPYPDFSEIAACNRCSCSRNLQWHPASEQGQGTHPPTANPSSTTLLAVSGKPSGCQSCSQCLSHQGENFPIVHNE